MVIYSLCMCVMLELVYSFNLSWIELNFELLLFVSISQKFDVDE